MEQLAPLPVPTIHLQLLRFAIIGVGSNIVLYLMYLAMTRLGIGYVPSLTVLYIIGVSQTFIFNKRWSFTHSGDISRSMLRYVATYVGCYLLNLAVLGVSVDYFGFDHAVIQAMAILPIALLVFLLQRYWVFPAAKGQLIKRHS